MTRAEKKRRLSRADATVDLTRFLDLPKYLGCGGRGFPTGPSPKRLINLQKSNAGGGSKVPGGTLVIARINKHQLSVLETVEIGGQDVAVDEWRYKSRDEGGGGLAMCTRGQVAKLKVPTDGCASPEP